MFKSLKLNNFEHNLNDKLISLWNYFQWEFLNSIVGRFIIHYGFVFCLSGLCRGYYAPILALGTILIEHSKFDDPFGSGRESVEMFRKFDTHAPEYLKLAKDQFELATFTTLTIANQLNNNLLYVNSQTLQQSVEKDFSITEQRFLGDTTKIFKLLYYYYTESWKTSVGPEIAKQVGMTTNFYKNITDNLKTPHRHFCIQYNSKEAITCYRFYPLTSTGIPKGTAIPAEILADHSSQQYINAGIIHMEGCAPLTGGKTSLIPSTGKFVSVNESLILDCQQIVSKKIELLQQKVIKAMHRNTETTRYTQLGLVIKEFKLLLQLLNIYPEKMGNVPNVETLIEIHNKIMAINLEIIKAHIRETLTVIPQVPLLTQQSEENLQVAMEKVENTKTLSDMQKWKNTHNIGVRLKPQVQCINVNNLQVISRHPLNTQSFQKIINRIANNM